MSLFIFAYVSLTAMMGSSLSSLSSLLDVLRKLPLRWAGPGAKWSVFLFFKFYSAQWRRQQVTVMLMKSLNLQVLCDDDDDKLYNNNDDDDDDDDDPLISVCPRWSTRCLPSQRSCWDDQLLLQCNARSLKGDSFGLHDLDKGGHDVDAWLKTWKRTQRIYLVLGRAAISSQDYSSI